MLTVFSNLILFTILWKMVKDDLLIYKVSDRLIIFGLLIALVFSSFNRIGFLGSVGGLFSGFLMIYITAMIIDIYMDKYIISGGDIKAMAMIGAFIGWPAILYVFILAPVFGMIHMIIKKRKAIPYILSISLATVIVVLINWKTN